ncbi:MAG: tetratricopeptide repeat protein [Chitinivibrionales bacterium]|nr:tetratricopeptide repeat protein [Chitinivibrionales bacterium]
MVRMISVFLLFVAVCHVSDLGAVESGKKAQKPGQKNSATSQKSKISKVLADSIALLQQAIDASKADKTTYTELAGIYDRLADYKNSVTYLEKAIELDPRDKVVLMSLGRTYEKLNNSTAAQQYYEKSIEVDSTAVETYKALGDLHKKNKNAEQAIVFYRLYYEKGGRDAAITPQVMSSYLRGKEYAKLITSISQIPQEDQTLEDQQLLAEALYQSKEYAKALEFCTLVLSKKLLPDARSSFVRKAGLSSYYLNDTANAISYFTQFNKLSKVPDADVLYYWAMLQEKTKPDIAMKLYDLNTKRFPKDYRNYLQLAMLLAKSPKNKTRVSSLVLTVTKLSDTVAPAWIEIAKVYRLQKNSRAELEAYKKYKSLLPDDFRADIRIGTILLEQNEVDEALRVLESIKDKASNSPSYNKALSAVYLKKNMAREAIAILEQVQSKEKTPNIETAKSLASAYLQAGLNDKAEVLLKVIIEKERTPELLLKYGQVLYKTGKLADAENAVMEILATADPDVATLMLLASIQSASKKYEEAIKTYAEVTSIDPENIESFYERAELYRTMQKILWAEKFYNRALTLDSTHALSYLGLAKAAATRNDKEKYRDYLEKARSLAPNNPTIKQELSQLK